MIKYAKQLKEQLDLLVSPFTFTNICQQSVTGSDKPEVSMATTCSTATDGGVDHSGSSSNEREPVLPRFGMKKGVVQRAGHILWKGKYIDQNEFYKVRPFYIFQK